MSSAGWAQGGAQLLSGLGALTEVAARWKAAGKTRKAADDAAEALFALADEYGIPVEDLVFAFNNPNLGNAILAGGGTSVLTQLGMPIGGTLRQGSPQGLLVNAAGALGLSQSEFNRVSNEARAFSRKYSRLIDQGVPHGKARRKALRGLDDNAIRQVVSAAGFPSIGRYAQAQSEYETQSRDIEDMYAAIQPQILQGRLSASETISQIQQDYPVATAENISAMEDRVRSVRLSELEEEERRLRERALYEANAMGTNPAGVLGEISRLRGEQQYEIEQTGALERALAIMSGRTNLANSALQGLSGSLNAPLQAAAQFAGLQSQGSQSMGQLAAQQAIALNQLQVRQEEFENLLRQAGINVGLSGKLGQIAWKVGAAQAGAEGLREQANYLSMYGGGGGGGGGTSGISAPAGSLLGGSTPFTSSAITTPGGY